MDRTVFSPDFKARVLEARADEQAGKGTATFLVAAFGVPDTEVAVGNESRQIIDEGAFRTWIEEQPDRRVPFYRDHGDAHITGYVDSGLKLGFADNFREGAADGQKGLLFDAHYNLRTDEGRNAFEDARFAPDLVQASFRWPPDETIVKGDDGFEHVTEFHGIDEVSQVGFGAQEKTGVVAGSLRSARTAVASHSTATSDATWDGPTNKARLNPGDETNLKKAFAWYDPGGDDPNGDGLPDAKADWKFIHHEVSADGTAGAANTTACSTGIGVLNGGRGGTVIPDGDRRGVYNHLAKHLRDAGQDNIPELRVSDTEGQREADGEPLTARATKEELAAHLKAAHGKAGEGTHDELTKSHSKAHADRQFADGMGHGGLGNLMTSRAAALRQGVPVERVVQLVREAWWSAHMSTPTDGAASMSSYVEEVYADDAALDAGQVIVWDESGSYRQVPWARTEAGVTFDEAAAVEVEKDWQPLTPAQRAQIIEAWLRSRPDDLAKRVKEALSVATAHDQRARRAVGAWYAGLFGAGPHSA